MSFGEKLAKLRKDAGMNQEELANKLNVSRQAVSKWESNSSYPETDKIVAICKLFNCSIDDLMGISAKEERQEKKKEKNGILKTIDYYFDMFLKGINMFFSMTVKQKIICLLEIAIFAIIVIIGLAILGELIEAIFYKIFSIIPYSMKAFLISIISGLYLALCIFVFIYAVFKFYKVRYLDYYISSFDEKEVVVEKPKESINLNNEKIILRDPTNAYKPFNFLKKIFLVIIKLILGLILVGLIIVFALSIASLLINFSFISVGKIAIYTLFIFGALILFVYVLMEVILRFIFNKKIPFLRTFIMFCIALVIFGISSGLFALEFSKFTIIEDENDTTYKVYEETINMQDNLILWLDASVEAREVVFENRDDLLVEIYASSTYAKAEKIEDNEAVFNGIDTNIYSLIYYRISYDNRKIDISEYLDRFKESLKRKEIVIIDDYSHIHSVLHISEENYKKLKANEREYSNNF